MNRLPVPSFMDLFDKWWDAIAEQGCCDARGGAEYRRVRDLWQEKGYPTDILTFITFYANHSSGMGGCCGQ